MKKTLLSLCLFMSIGLSYAQKNTFGIKGGLNLSTVSYSSTSGSTESSSSLAGFHAGVFADFSLSSSVSFQPALLYTTKGAKETSSQSTSIGNITFSAHGNSTMTINYIELPINLLYHFPVTAGKFFVGGGPYIAWGISGKIKADETITQTSGSTSSITNINGENNVTFGNNGAVKNPDYGINLLGGIALKKGLLFSIGYGIGIANLSNVDNSSSRNNGFSLSVGYSFL